MQLSGNKHLYAVALLTMRDLPSLAYLSVRTETRSQFEFVTIRGEVVVSLQPHSDEHVALVGVRKSGDAQISAPVAGRHGAARIVYGGKEGTHFTPAGVECTRTFLSSAHNRGYAKVLVVNGYMIGRLHMAAPADIHA